MADAKMQDALAAARAAGVNALNVQEHQVTEDLNRLSQAEAEGKPRPATVPPDITLPMEYSKASLYWAEKEVKEARHEFDKGLESALKDGSLKPLGPDTPAGTEFNQIAGRLGFQQAPKLYVFSNDSEVLPPTQLSLMSENGQPYIIATHEFFTALTPREQKAVDEHELLQIRDGNLNPESMARQLINPEEAMRLKYRTDNESTDPAALASVLRKGYEANLHIWQEKNPSLSPEQVKTEFDMYEMKTSGEMMAHPPTEERLKRLDAMAKRMGQQPYYGEKVEHPDAPLPTPPKPQQPQTLGK